MNHLNGIVLSLFLCMIPLQHVVAQTRIIHISTIHIQQHSKKPLASVRIASGNSGTLTDNTGHADFIISIKPNGFVKRFNANLNP